MRDYRTVITEMKTKQAEYQAVARTANADELDQRTKEIVTLQDELKKTIAAGANDCPVCKQPAVGFMKRDAHQNVETGLVSLPLFEVGCLGCGANSRAHTPELAVKSWNER